MAAELVAGILYDPVHSSSESAPTQNRIIVTERFPNKGLKFNLHYSLLQLSVYIFSLFVDME